MIDVVSLETLTDEEIEDLSMRRVKAAVGGAIDLVGTTEPNHAESPPSCECTLCNNGQRLDVAGKAVCLRCSRASRRIDQVIESVRREDRILKALNAKRRVNMIKAKAAAQRLGRRGAKLNPANKKAVMDAIRNGIAGQE